MEALTQACQVIPRHPANSPSSAPGILERWRKRTGVAVNTAAGQENTAWEVRDTLPTTLARGCHSTKGHCC